VMVNLLGNAVKFSPPGGTVEVTVEELPDVVCVKVTDQGRGIPKHMLTSVFERFKQVEVADATKKKGSGLGLAICKAIIEQHGGTIGVESEEGRGSTFWFKLPTVAQAVHASVRTE
jgi:signal transduction histidine kinase